MSMYCPRSKLDMPAQRASFWRANWSRPPLSEQITHASSVMTSTPLVTDLVPWPPSELTCKNFFRASCMHVGNANAGQECEAAPNFSEPCVLVVWARRVPIASHASRGVLQTNGCAQRCLRPPRAQRLVDNKGCCMTIQTLRLGMGSCIHTSQEAWTNERMLLHAHLSPRTNW